MDVLNVKSIGPTYVESSVHGLSEPDVFAVLALAGPPVLLGGLGDAGVDAGLSGLHVAEGLDGVGRAADVGINPVVAWRDERGGSERRGDELKRTELTC